MARGVFERYRYFRREMDCVFDTEFGMRLAFAGELPEMIDRKVAVWVVHCAIADPPS